MLAKVCCFHDVDDVEAQCVHKQAKTQSHQSIVVISSLLSVCAVLYHINASGRVSFLGRTKRIHQLSAGQRGARASSSPLRLVHSFGNPPTQSLCTSLLIQLTIVFLQQELSVADCYSILLSPHDQRTIVIVLHHVHQLTVELPPTHI
jgi:hypothetical protein